MGLDWSKWFQPRCLVDPCAKRWVEDRLQWLMAAFPRNVFTGGKVMVLPTPEFFPEPFDGSKLGVHKLLKIICGHIGVDRERIELRVSDSPHTLWLVDQRGQALPHAAGTYHKERKQVVTVHKSMLADPPWLAAIIAHELAHVLLIGGKHESGEDYDSELLTDLAVVHLGLGVLRANSNSYWPSGNTFWPGTMMIKPAYMTLPMFGWALAHAAWFRGEAKPIWLKYVRWGVRTEVRHDLRYLIEIGDSTFRPPAYAQPTPPGA